MTADDLAGRLTGRLFLSSMMGWCDAPFCASRAKGCAMVQLGAYVTLEDYEERDLYHPDPDPDRLTAFMREQFDACREQAAAVAGADDVPLISANVFPLTDEDVATSAEAFVEAGGDLYELNSHGGIGNDRERGTGAMLFIPEHRRKLMRWARILVDAGGPVIIKARGSVIPDFTDHVRELEQIGVPVFHVNVRDAETKAPDLRLLEAIRKATDMLLLASGFVTDAAGAKAMFDAGADCVGIAQAAIEDPDIFLKCAT